MAKILVADDVYSELQLIQKTLISHGHQIVTAMDGEEALKKTSEEKPDLIILDVIMPKKNGFQVCRIIKKTAELKDIPVILVTSKDQDSDKFWGKKQGADEYITKPFKPDELIAAVTKFI